MRPITRILPITMTRRNAAVRYLAPAEVAEVLGVSRDAIYAWLRTGYITGTRSPGPRGRWRIPTTEIDRLRTEAVA